MTVITHADRELIESLCKEIENDVFHLMDAEHDFSGDFAGEAAHAAVSAVRALLERELAISP